MQNFENKVALITGASRGIGKAIAETLASQGAKVIGTATSDKGAAAISEYLGSNGEGLALDVTDSESLQQTIKDIEKKYGSIDILVNNAGITRDNLMMRMKDDEWDAVLNTNLSAVFKVCKAVVRGMMKR
ncbi:SDR family NAD(P)-dependent oxidoreductase, partial [Idiomarina abyssalis]